MKQISERYSRLFKEFYADKAKDRFDYVLRYADFYSKTLPYKNKVNCIIDPLSVDAYVTSYFLDVIKFKEYHFREHLDPSFDYSDVETSFQHPDTTVAEFVMHRKKMINASKVGAFTGKWLLKYRPVVVMPKDGCGFDIFERRHIQNAPFVFTANVTLRSMGIDPDELPTAIYKSLMYHLRYREYEDRNVMLYFELLVEHVSLLRETKG